MNKIDILIIGLLFAGFASIFVSWFRGNLKCPAPKVVYRYIPKHTLDVQFGEENLAGTVFKQMFSKGTPSVGGYDLSWGKTYAPEEEK